MSDTSDILTVYFDSNLEDESALYVSRKHGENIIILKMELGEQADILYHLLTEQMTRVEIEAESEDKNMTEQWQELKETITELRDNDGTGTQQEVCKFLVNYMEVLEKQMQEPILDKIRAEIEKQKEERCFDDDDMFVYRTGLNDALYIIDKYKSGSEDKDADSN